MSINFTIDVYYPTHLIRAHFESARIVDLLKTFEIQHARILASGYPDGRIHFSREMCHPNH